MNYDKVRFRFAPSIPASGGDFLHVGHAAMLTCAAYSAREHYCPLDIRLDDPHKKAGSIIDGSCLLDVMNLICWLGIKVRQIYITQDVGLYEVMQNATGDTSLYNTLTPWQINSAFDDIVRYKTVIVRGNEFVDAKGANSLAKDESFLFWGKKPLDEINFPMMLSGGRKVSKSNGIAPHWRTLQKYDSVQVQKYFWRMAQLGRDYEIDWSFPV